MKTKLLILLSFISSVNLFAQGSLNITWNKTVFNSGTSGAESWGVDVDNSGNVYWPVSTDTTNQNLDIKCYKYDANGNPLWNSPYYITDAGNQKAFIIKATDSIIYIGGQNCPPLGFGVNCFELLLKVDANTGAYIDSFNYKFNNTFGYNEVDDIHLYNDGIILSGWAQTSGGSFETEMGFLKVAHNLDSILWQNTFGQSPGGEHQDGHIVIDNNYIYACGLWGGSGIANLYDGQSLLAKFDLNGAAFVDSVLFGNVSPFLNLENALGMTSDGTNLYVTGYTTIAPNDGQIFVSCFDKNLNLIWTHNWGGTAFENSRAIEVSDGYIYIGGASGSINSNSGKEGVLLKYDTVGNFITYRTYSTAGHDEIRDMKIDGTNIYLSGASSSDTSTNKTETAFLLKCDLNLITSLNENKNDFAFIVYPNPANEIIAVELYLKSNSKTEIALYDFTGRKIKILAARLFNEGMNLLQYNLEEFTEGIYTIRIKTGEISCAIKIVKMQ